MQTDKHNPIVFSGELIRKIFDSLSAHIAIIDEQGLILETNSAWRRFSKENGMAEPMDFTQINYLHICESSTGEGTSDAKAVALGIRQVVRGDIKEFLYDYPCHSPQGPRWFYMRAVLMAEKEPKRVIISHEDITPIKLAEQALKENQQLLEDKNQSLNESNIALKVLIRQREQDKAEMEKKFMANIKTLVLPYVNKLKKARLNQKDRALVRIVDDHINDIVSPLLQNLNNAGIMLTPQEIQVASLVKDGKTTSEIADILYISETTVNFHRKNLRKKLGLNNRRANLRSFLLSMS